ncbi:hypothetical protein [Caldimonas brevitalea]|uniref:DUF697 domain-containing protein n=1 Tax=Caldimonas brevitalea TaxID=413882 RepID=A0A0G3BMS6_9BURK|nr:hypothetical protein [Caldimonas brevitalea]AKJ28686.1 hypothetical protein AAW51_1995 [Caldimonas brevitalea]
MKRSPVATVVPSSPVEIEQVARECRRLVTRRAAMAAGVAVLPVPGLDWLTDVGVLVQLFRDINQAFGLTPEQVERLSPHKRVYAYKAITAAGGFVVGRVVTREVVLKTLKLVGVRLTTQQAAKFVPVAGQAVSAALTFSTLKLVCEQHIRQCIEVVEVLLKLPEPQAASDPSAAVSSAGPDSGGGIRPELGMAVHPNGAQYGAITAGSHREGMQVADL